MAVGGKTAVEGTHDPAVRSFELGAVLGSGSFGQVYGCTDPLTGEELACKVIPREQLGNEFAIEAVKREVGVMRKLCRKHRGIVELREVGQDEQGSVLMFMELCRGGDLFDLLKTYGRLPETAAWLILRQVVGALNVCHVMGVVHRDIKPENILLDKCGRELYHMDLGLEGPPGVNAKLADFGLAVELTNGCKTSGFVGSPQYAAPEVIQGGLYGRAADVWSLGVVLYAMLSGRLPFASKADNPKELKKAISSGRVSFGSPVWSTVSEEAKDLVKWMMEVDETKRPSAVDVMFHGWVTGKPGESRRVRGNPKMEFQGKMKALPIMDPICV